MNPRTAEVYNEIKRAAAEGQKYISPAIFSYVFDRASTSAAFRLAKKHGIIEVSYMGCTGVPVYRAAGTGQAIIEAQTATKN